MSNEVHQQVLNTIEKLENIVCNQAKIDTLWEEIKKLFLNELSLLPDLPKSNSKKSSSKFKKCRTFWNQELANCWQSVCSTEKEYLAFKVQFPQDNFVKRQFHEAYKNAQKKFDVKFRFFKRQNKKQELFDLEQASLHNPQNMWEKLKKLNNPPSSKAVLEIIRDDESISTDIEEILARWHRDISNLFSGLRGNPDFAFDDNFFEEIKIKKEEFEKLCPENLSSSGLDSTELIVPYYSMRFPNALIMQN